MYSISPAGQGFRPMIAFIVADSLAPFELIGVLALIRVTVLCSGCMRALYLTMK